MDHRNLCNDIGLDHNTIIVTSTIVLGYNPLWNDEQSYMTHNTGVARWNTYMTTIGSSDQKQNVAILVITEI